jgi:hypothetical protein
VADELSVDVGAAVARLLGPRAGDRFQPRPAAGAEVVRCADVLDLDRLRAAIDRCGFAAGGGASSAVVDRRAAASRWLRHYAGAVLQAVLAAMAAGVGLDASLPRASVVMSGTIPRGIHLHHPGANAVVWPPRALGGAGGARSVASLTDLHAHVLAGAVAKNLMPVMERVHQLVRISSHTLWCNVAEQIEGVYEHAAERLGPAAAPLLEDHRALVESAAMPGVPGPNPLASTLEWDPVDEPHFPPSLHRRRVCCITFLLPDRPGEYCWNCPHLSLAQRVALARSRGVGRPI